MNRVLLLYPKTKFKFNDFPLALNYLKAAINANIAEAKVDVVDLNLFEGDFTDLILDLKPNFVGITATLPLTNEALNIAKRFKNINPNCILIAGGSQPTLTPNMFLSDFNVVVRHEGESTICDIVNGVSLKNIKGISYKSEGKIIHNPNKELIENLDFIPFPDRKNIQFYKDHIYENKQIIPLISSRGCPYKCIFCSKEICGTRLRFRSPENIIKEMYTLAHNNKDIVFQFRDDIFTFNRKRTIEFCKQLINGNYNFEWLCNTRADCVDEELLRLMYNAGCKRISFGAETGDNKLLNILNKNLTVEQILQASKLARKIGIKLKYYLIVGIPTQTPESINKTLNLIKEGKPDEIYCSVFTPMIGSQIWDEKDDLGIKLLFNPELIEDWEKVFYQSNLDFEESLPPIETKHLSKEEIVYYRKKIFDTHKIIN